MARAASLAESLASSAPPIDNKREAHKFARDVMHGLRTLSGDRVAWDQVTVASRSRWPFELQVTRAILEYVWKTKISDYSGGAPRSHHRRIDVPGLLRDMADATVIAPSRSSRAADRPPLRERRHRSRSRDNCRHRGRDRSRTPRRHTVERPAEAHASSQPPRSPVRCPRMVDPPAHNRSRRVRSAPASSRRAMRNSVSPCSRAPSQTLPAVASASRGRSRSSRRAPAATATSDSRSQPIDGVSRGFRLYQKYRSASRSTQPSCAVRGNEPRRDVNLPSAQCPRASSASASLVPDPSRHLMPPPYVSPPEEAAQPNSSVWAIQLLTSDDIFLATLNHETQSETKLRSFAGRLHNAADPLYVISFRRHPLSRFNRWPALSRGQAVQC